MSEKMKILIGYDGSEGADVVLKDLGRAGLPSEAEAQVISVAEPWFLLSAGIGGIDPVFFKDSILESEQARSFAEKATEQIRSKFPGWKVEHHVAFGSPVEKLLAKADEWKSDLVILGSHGHTLLGRFFLGSVSQSVATQAHCNVRIARIGPDKRLIDPDSPVRIIVGVDGSPGAEAAVLAVASRRWPAGSEARVINSIWTLKAISEQPVVHEHVALQAAEWSTQEKLRATETAASAAEKLKAAGLITSLIVREENPKRLLLSEAESWDANCIFVGARGLGRFERLLLGSVSTAVVMRAHCSVEVVRLRDKEVV